MPSALRRLPPLAAAFASAIGLLVLAGWALDVGALKTVLPGLGSMKANTAACFLVAGVASWVLVARNPSPMRTRIVVVLGAAVSSLGALTLLQYASGLELGIDELLVRDEASRPNDHPGRMGPNVASSFLALGFALLLLLSPRRTPRRLAHLLLVTVVCVAFAALVGYAVGVPSLYRVSTWAGMALHTALAFAVLAVGLLASCPDFLATRLLASDRAPGAVVRRLLPAAVLLPPALAWLVHAGNAAGLYKPEAETWLLVASLVTVLIGLVLAFAATLERVAAKRRGAEEALRAAEERYRSLTETLPLLTYVDQLNESSTSIYITPQVQDMLGYAQQPWVEEP